jgi:hypothetical protein
VLTAFAAASASAQTAGAVTVVTQPDLQSCTVSGVSTTGAGGVGSGTVAFARGQMLDKVATEQGVVAFATTTAADGAVTKLTVTRADDGTVTVRDGEGNIVKPTEAKSGVFEMRSKDGNVAAVTVAGHSGALVASVRSADDDAKTVVGTSKESPKYHVKRPAATTVASGELREMKLTEAVAGAHAQIIAADGVALARPVQCKVIIRDNN